MVTVKDLIDPVDFECHGMKFKIGHVPAFEADGLYDQIILAKGITPEEVKTKLLAYVVLLHPNGEINLDKKVIVDEYIKPWVALRKLINKCVDVNFDFLEDGATSQD